MHDSIVKKAEVSSHEKDKHIGSCDSRKEEKRRIFGYKIKCCIKRIKSWRPKMFHYVPLHFK